jgi:hypothetical protein
MEETAFCNCYNRGDDGGGKRGLKGAKGDAQGERGFVLTSLVCFAV